MCFFPDCSSSPTFTSPVITTVACDDPKCVDKLDNCDDFGDDACTGIFHSWALDNCPRHCGLCKLLFVLFVLSSTPFSRIKALFTFVDRSGVTALLFLTTLKRIILC